MTSDTPSPPSTPHAEVSDVLRLEIKTLLIDALGFDDVTPDEVADDVLLFEEESGLGIDSVDALEIAAALHRAYGLRIADQNIGQFVIRTVTTIAQAVANHQAGIAPKFDAASTDQPS